MVVVIPHMVAVAVLLSAGSAPGLTAAGAAGEDHPFVGDWPAESAAFRPVPLRAVRVGGFLGGRIDANNHNSLLAGLTSPLAEAIEARSRGQDPPRSSRRLATDSDFFKWLEGACYAVAYEPSLKELSAAVDRYARMLAVLQEPDGFLGTRLSPAEPFDTRAVHDLYVAGHFIEAAVAHHAATGERTLLDAAIRLADFYLRAFEAGHPYFEIVGTREHPEIEPALVRLYRTTGEKRFLDFAAAICAMSKVGPTLADVHAGGGARHAVRVGYLLSGLAELYLTTGEERFRGHLGSLWEELISTRMYVTGGFGASETLPLAPYDLPQNLDSPPGRDVAETCASVAMMMLGWRMHAMTGEARCFDVIETILYNHVIGAVSPDHLGTFYYNPLRRIGDLAGRTDHDSSPDRRTRLPKLHSTACCMPNTWRLFAQLPEYVFSAGKDVLLVNLYTDATAEYTLPDGRTVRLVMNTGYPHDGKVEIRVETAGPVRLALGLRIPAWCDGASVVLNQDDAKPAASGGYHRIERSWQDGDRVTLDLPMPARVIRGRPQVAGERGLIALARGPLVYCLEEQDAAGIPLEELLVRIDPDDPGAGLQEEFHPDLGLHVLKVRASRGRPSVVGEQTLAADSPETREVMLIPFFFRANRQDNARWVTWLPSSSAGS
jgi:uncharacterized protein